MQRSGAMFEAMLPAFPKEGTEFIMDKMEVHGDLAYIAWHGSTPVLDIPFATDTFIIQGGKIVKQTFGGLINPVDQPDS